MRPWLVIVLLLTVVGVSAAPVQDLQRGYNPRACGFDMDGDGIWGEPLDDCNVGDGVTTDPDGDGQDEDIYYVDCDTGTDQPSCGTAGGPCKSIDYALNTRADGPGDGAEDIIAFTGTCTDVDDVRIETAHGGIASTYTVPPSGNEVRSFQYPQDPTMIIGWDKDDDGCYPPYDDGVTDPAACGATGDTAFIDGATGDGNHLTLHHTFHVNQTSYLEFAHFSVANYGVGNVDINGGPSAGFMTGTPPDQDYMFFHDLELDSINRDTVQASTAITFDVWSSNDRDWWAVENIKSTNDGSYFMRGNSGSQPASNWRFQNIYLTHHGCDVDNIPRYCENDPSILCSSDPDCSAVGGVCNVPTQGSDCTTVIAKIWGYTDGVEWLDNIFDGNVNAWNPRKITGLGPTTCTQDWDIVNNEFIDMKVALDVQYNSPTQCGAIPRTTHDIVFDRNIFIDTTNSTWENSGGTPIIISAQGEDEAGEHIEDVTITNNFFYWTGPYFQNCLHYTAGTFCRSTAPNYPACLNFVMPGTITFAGNTCHGPTTGMGGWQGMFSVSPNLNWIHRNWVVKNNIFSGADPGDRAMVFKYGVANLDSDYNVFDSLFSHSYVGNNNLDLVGWQSFSGQDGNSKNCVPAYAGVTTGNLHLLSGDTCAQDAGVAIAGLAIDIDGDSRPQGAGWDIGADEYASGGPSCHWADTDCSGAVSIPELVAVILGWQSGSRSIPELVDAILAWQG